MFLVFIFLRSSVCSFIALSVISLLFAFMCLLFGGKYLSYLILLIRGVGSRDGDYNVYSESFMQVMSIMENSIW